MNRASEIILSVEGLTKIYGKQKAVDGITFSVKKGEVFGILGPNGAGKTTALEMIETLRSIDKGRVVLDGFDVSKEPAKVKQIIGIQLQSSAFFEYLYLDELLRMYGSLYREGVDTEDLLSRVDLVKKKRSFVKELSGGQKQRFSVAVALVNKPKVIFLDEPTTGLDPQARRNLWNLVKEIQASGITVVLTTHYMDEAEILCDRLAIMNEGKIVAMNTPENLVKELLARGFKKKQTVQQANLDDVFIDITGKGMHDV